MDIAAPSHLLTVRKIFHPAFPSGRSQEKPRQTHSSSAFAAQPNANENEKKRAEPVARAVKTNED